MRLIPHTGFLVATYPPGATFGPRRLRDWEFVWMVEGDAEYRRDDGNGEVAYSAPEGSLVLCQPETTDFFRWDPVRRTRHAYFHFELTGEMSSAWPFPTEWPVVRTVDSEGDLLRPLFNHLLAWNGAGDGLQQEYIALSLLAGFVTGQTEMRSTGQPRLPDLVAQTLAYIARRLDDEPSAPLPLSDLADNACVTPEYLCRVFKKATGRSPAETVRLARLDRAIALLTHTNYSVGEIAHLSGFESPFHFSRLVRATYGRSPRALRQAIVSGEHIPAARWMRGV